MLVSQKLGLSEHLPPHPQRGEILEALIRDKLAEPEGASLREDEIMTLGTPSKHPRQIDGQADP